MRSRRQDSLYEFCCGRAGLLRPLDDPRRSPIQVLLMSFRHVLGNGGIASFFEAALMSYNALGIKEDLHSIDSDKGLYFLATKVVGNTVIMIRYINMVIDVDRRPLEVDVSVSVSRQWLKTRFLHGLKKLSAGAV